MQLMASSVAGDDPLQHVGKPGERLNAVELAVLDQKVSAMAQ